MIRMLCHDDNIIIMIKTNNKWIILLEVHALNAERTPGKREYATYCTIDNTIFTM